MGQMKVALLRDVRGTGAKGVIVNVPDGYARNFLIPKKLATVATSGVIEEIKRGQQRSQDRQKEALRTARALAQSLGSVTAVVKAPAAENGHLFGSVTDADIRASLKESGFSIGDVLIVIDRPIDKIGTHRVGLDFGHGIRQNLSVTVDTTS